MLIAVVSDTHREEYIMDKVKKMISHADVLIHLGDNIDDLDYIKQGFEGPTYGVKGNCDYSGRGFEDELVIELDGVKFLITHGHNYSVKYGLTNLSYRAEEVNADVALFGHTHTACIEDIGGITLFNPGSASYPRLGKNSIGFIEIDKRGDIIPYLKQV